MGEEGADFETAPQFHQLSLGSSHKWKTSRDFKQMGEEGVDFETAPQFHQLSLGASHKWKTSRGL